MKQDIERFLDNYRPTLKTYPVKHRIKLPITGDEFTIGDIVIGVILAGVVVGFTWWFVVLLCVAVGV